MRYRSTRNNAPLVTFGEAMARGLAPDGGLYVPESLPRLDVQAGDFVDVAQEVLAPFMAGDSLADDLSDICRDAFDFPIPLTPLGAGPAAVLELFWGPTAAFKDFGARFLAECMARQPIERTILVATSGDTGGAVAAAFWKKPGIRVAVLFPDGGVSEMQRQQLTCWGENVHAFAVRGTFDDCQGLLKRALSDTAWTAQQNLTTANSINIGRLLPQVAYYAWAALRYRTDHGVAPSFVVPSGNVGNATAALWARSMGLPIADITMVTNANRTVPDFFETGDWQPRSSVATLANAMDVGAPSNMERVFDLFEDREVLRRAVHSKSVDDDAIREEIRSGPTRYNRVWDPHTATAAHAFGEASDPHQILVATAHPAKFESVVEPLVEPLVENQVGAVEMPPALAALRAPDGPSAPRSNPSSQPSAMRWATHRAAVQRSRKVRQRSGAHPRSPASLANGQPRPRWFNW